jgi:26S proteasome regulatory subunit T3
MASAQVAPVPKDVTRVKSSLQSNDVYRKLKDLERELELLSIQEEYIKDETKNLKR